MAYPTYTLDTYALTTLGGVKEHLNILDADTTQNNVLTRMINSSTQMIENWLDRRVLRRQYTEYYDGRGNNRMLLANWPVEKPSELWDDTSSEFTDVSNKLATTEYQVDGDGPNPVGVVLIGRRFSKGTRNIKVIYYAGWTAVPAVIEEACILHVEFMFQMRSDRRIGTQTKGKNQENITYRSDVPEFVKEMLYPYQRIEVPLANNPVANY